MDEKIKKNYHDSRDEFDPEVLFNGKAHFYQYRAHYAEECVQYIRDLTKFNEGLVIADIGAGTGILSKQLMKYGAEKIYLIEPNCEMLNMARSELNGVKLHFVQATAENTTLMSNSIDLIVVGTAFHWFNMEEFRKECIRIAKRGAKIIILRLYNFVPDITEINSSSYHSISGENERLDLFFESGSFENKLFFHDEVFDENRFVMERLSDQNAPSPNAKEYGDFVDKAKEAYAYFGAKEISNVFITSCIIGEIENDN